MIPHMGFIANCNMPASVSLNGIEKPVRRSRSRFPPVMLSTVSIIMLTPASLARCSMARLRPRIFVEIELVDLWCRVRLTQLLKTYCPQRGHAKHCPVFCSRMRIYFRRRGQNKIRLRGAPGSPEFMDAYQLALSCVPVKSTENSLRREGRPMRGLLPDR